MHKIRRPHFQNRRRVFRLRFPSDSLLTATINSREYELIEVSEFGLVVTSEDIPCVEGQSEGQCEGTIHWNDGRSTKFTGELGRLSDFGRVIWKVQGISMSDIVKAQRELIVRYPGRTLRKMSAERTSV